MSQRSRKRKGKRPAYRRRGRGQPELNCKTELSFLRCSTGCRRLTGGKSRRISGWGLLRALMGSWVEVSSTEVAPAGRGSGQSSPGGGLTSLGADHRAGRPLEAQGFGGVERRDQHTIAPPARCQLLPSETGSQVRVSFLGQRGRAGDQSCHL